MLRGAGFVVAISVAAMAVAAGMARADDAYVTGSVKLIIVDKIAAVGKAKLVYLSKDKADADGDGNVAHKGAATPEDDPIGLTGSVDVFYRNDGANRATFALPESNWVVNKEKVAKYVNKNVPTGGGVKVAVVKNSAKLVKVVAKTLGDSSTIDLFAGDPGPDGMAAVLTIHNANDGQTHRMCTIFSSGSPSVKEIAGGTGRKLVIKSPVKMDVDFNDCITPISSPSGAFLD